LYPQALCSFLVASYDSQGYASTGDSRKHTNSLLTSYRRENPVEVTAFRGFCAVFLSRYRGYDFFSNAGTCFTSRFPAMALDPRCVVSGRIQQKILFPSLYPHNTSTVPYVFLATGTCLLSHCLAMNVYSGSDIPALMRHVTIYIYIYIYICRMHIL
jgi:hypothetical protein